MSSDETDFEALGEDLGANDPGEYNQKRRLQTIHDARDRVAEIEAQIDFLVAEGHKVDPRRMHRKAVERFIIELEQLIKNWETTNDGTELDFDYENGETGYWGRIVEVDGEQYQIGPNLGSVALTEDEVKEFIGLRSILETPDPIVVEFEETTTDRISGEQTQTVERRVQIPRHVLTAAERVCNEFLHEIDLDVQMRRSKPTDKL